MRAKIAPALMAMLALSACADPDATDQAPAPDQDPTQGAQAPAIVVSSEGGVTRYNTAGNLQSTFDIGCIDVAQVQNVYSPADLFKGSAACFQSGDSGRGVPLFAVAMAYGRYDIARVADTTAHQGIEMLKLSTFEAFSEQDQALISEGIQAMMHDPEAWSGFCTQLRALGPPAYHPDYMIQHGMRAFQPGSTEGDNGLVADFDSAAAWQLVDGYMRCASTNGDASTQAGAAERQLARIVDDAPSLAAATKLAVAEHYLSKGNWPNSNEQAGVDNSTLDPQIDIGTNGVITIRFTQPAELAGKSIVLTPRVGDTGDYVAWQCSGADIPPALRQDNCP